MKDHNPQIDIIFVYTIDQSMLANYQQGRLPQTIATFEAVAQHYSIPSINFGLAVFEDVRNQRLTFQGPQPAFSPDGTHPYVPSGHGYYAKTLSNAFTVIESYQSHEDIPTSAPLDAENWVNARLAPLSEARMSPEWRDVPPPLDVEKAQRFSQYFSHQWETDKPEALIEFSFTGTCLGFVGLKGPDSGEFEVRVDEKPPIHGTLYDESCTPGRYRIKPWFYPEDLPRGIHKVSIKTMTPANESRAINRICSLLIVN